MFYLLQQFLMDHGTVSLPRWGTLHLNTIPSVFHNGEQKFTAPQTIILWQEDNETQELSIQPLIGFLSRCEDETEEDCFEKLQVFINQLKDQIHKRGQVFWAGLGIFTLTTGKEGITFVPDPALQIYLKPIQANRIIKGGQSHEMLVGDTQTNTKEMQSYLHLQDNLEAPVKKDWWWVPALIGGLLGIALILAKWKGIV